MQTTPVLFQYKRCVTDSSHIFLYLDNGDMPSIKAGTDVYRNFDQEFEKALAKESASRKIVADILFEETATGYGVTMTDEDGNVVTVTCDWKKEDARTPQENNIRTQLSKLGNTGFEAGKIEVKLGGERFVPSSFLSDIRRQAVTLLENKRMDSYVRPVQGKADDKSNTYPVKELTYLGNVMNAQARTFYSDHGVEKVDCAFEKSAPDSAVIMFCRHCIKRSLGICPKNRNQELKVHEPMYLVSQDGRRFGLRFDCSRCLMEVYY